MTAHGVTVSGRGWAYVGTVLGAAVSVAANIAHSYVPPRCAPVSAGGVPGGEGCVPWTPPSDWAPPTEAVIGSALWPVLVVVAVEILTRVDWPPSGRWLAARWLGLLPVALVAAVISYVHGYGLLLHWGEGELAAALGPLAPDGLMVIASSALLIRRTDTPAVTVLAVPESVTRAVSVLAASAWPDTPAVTARVTEGTVTPVLGHAAAASTDTGTDTLPVPRNAKAPAASTSTPPDTAGSSRVVAHGGHRTVRADTAACTSTPQTVSEHVSTGDTDTDTDDDYVGDLIHAIAGTTDTELVDALRTSGTRTLRGAMKELGVGQTRARRVLTLAWPDTSTGSAS